MKHEGRDPVLKKSRWLLLKRSQNLGEEQHFRLRDLPLLQPENRARLPSLKEAFQQLWEYNSPTWAGKFLDSDDLYLLYRNNRGLTVQTWTTRTGQGPNCNTR